MAGWLAVLLAGPLVSCFSRTSLSYFPALRSRSFTVVVVLEAEIKRNRFQRNLISFVTFLSSSDFRRSTAKEMHNIHCCCRCCRSCRSAPSKRKTQGMNVFFSLILFSCPVRQRVGDPRLCAAWKAHGELQPIADCN